jgi:hypothetical protein
MDPGFRIQDPSSVSENVSSILLGDTNVTLHIPICLNLIIDFVVEMPQ